MAVKIEKKEGSSKKDVEDLQERSDFENTPDGYKPEPSNFDEDDFPEIINDDTLSMNAVTRNISSTPEEAAENIAGAKEFDVTPELFKNSKEVFTVAQNDEKRPSRVRAPIMKAMSKSSEHAAIINEDLDMFEGWGDYLELAVEKYKGSDFNRDISDLQYRAATGVPLDDQDQLDLDNLNEMSQKLKTHKDFGYTEGEVLPLDLAIVGIDMVKGLLDNKTTLTTGALLGASLSGIPAALIGAFAGPGGALALGGPAALTGAIRGGVTAIPFAMFADTYKQTTGSVYNELTYKLHELEPSLQDVAEDERRSIAKGAGFLAAAISMIPAGRAIRKIPIFKALVTPKSYLKYITSPKGKVFGNLLNQIGTQALFEGVEELAQEEIQIIAAELGPTWDGNETDLLEAFSNINDNLSNGEVRNRLVKAATIGALAGGTFAAGGVAASNVFKDSLNPTPEIAPEPEEPTPIVRENENLPPVVKGLRAVQMMQIIDQTVQTTTNSRTNEVSPKEMDQLRQEMFEEQGLTYFFFQKDELTEWADTEEKAADVRAAIGDDIKSGEINAPMAIKASTVMRLMDKYPELSNIATVHPEQPTAAQWVARLEERERRVKELGEKLSEGEGVPADVDREIRDRDEDIFDEGTYLEQPTFTEAMNHNLPSSEIMQVNEAQLNTRVEIADSIKAEKDKKMEKIETLSKKNEEALQSEIDADRTSNEADIEVLENYLNEEDIASVKIDPNTVHNSILRKYGRTENVTKREVFADGGIDIKDAVAKYGAKSATDLVRIVSETSTREEALAAQIEEVLTDIDDQNKKSEEYEKSKIAKSYDNMTRIHVRELKHLVKNYWPAVKKGIKRIALSLPKFSELSIRAKERVYRTKISDLNVNKWEVAIRKSNRKSVDAVLKNELEVAFREKENAALATQLSKHTRVAIGKANAAIRWIARFKSKRIQNVLKEAGPSYTKAANDILELFHTSDKADKIANYNNWAKKMTKEGEGNVEIPEAVLTWLDTTESISEMSVDQVLAMNDILKNIYHRARLKNRLVRIYTVFHKSQATEIIREDIEEHAEKHPNYSASRAEEAPPVSNKAVSNTKALFNTYSGSVQNIKFGTLELDNEKEGGYFFNLIFKPLADALLRVNQLKAQVREGVNSAIDEYGRKDYEALGRVKVYVPEFAKALGLNKGKLLKIDLLRMQMNMGNDGNIEAVSNYGISIDLIRKVLERELQPRDFDYVQKVWDTFEVLAPILQEVHRESTGTDLELVSQLAFDAHGKEYKGGYFPIRLSFGVATDNLVQASINARDTLKEKGSAPYAAYEGVVRSKHTKTRKGSKWLVDLDSASMSTAFDDVIHDIAYRVPVRDIMQILNDDVSANHMKAVLGINKFGALRSNVARLTHNVGSSDLQIHNDINRHIVKMLKTIEGNTILNWLALSPSTFFINLLAFREVGSKLGAMGSGRMTMVTARLTKEILTGRADNSFEFAASIDPSIFGFREGIDDFTQGTLHGMIPKTRIFDSKVYHSLKDFQEGLNDFAMSGVLGYQDQMVKTVAVITAYEQYLAGEAPGSDANEVYHMTEDEREARAKNYALSVVSSTTIRASTSDKSSIQFEQKLIFFTKLWNELRQVLNNRFSIGREISIDNKAFKKHLGNKDYVRANAALTDSTGGMFKLIVLGLIGNMMMNMSQGDEPFPTPGEEPETLSLDSFSIEKAAKWIYGSVTSFEGVYDLISDGYISGTPLLRDVAYGTETGRGPSIPLLTGGLTLGESGLVGYELMQDMADGASFADALEGTSESEIKGMLSALGVVTGGLPVSAVYKWRAIVEHLVEENGLTFSPDGTPAPKGADPAFASEGDESFKDKFVKHMKEFIEKHKNNSKLADMVAEATEALKDISGFEGKGLTNEDISIIKFAESSGNRFAGAGTSSAKGLYQFTDDTWLRLVNSSQGQDAGLTLNGVYDEDQQEAAMDIFTGWNMDKLKRHKVPVNLMSVYYMHHFDNVFDAKKIFLGDDSDSMKGTRTLSKANIKSNSGRKNSKDNLDQVKTVKDMKKYLQRQTDRGKRGYKKSLIDKN